MFDIIEKGRKDISGGFTDFCCQSQVWFALNILAA